MGTVAGLFILETMWSGINKQIPIEEMANSAAETFAHEASRRKSFLVEDMKRRGSMMIDGLKSKTVRGTKDGDV